MTGARQTAARPHVVCLLPVRNGEADLPGWFASVERFADAVVALDDGSTDGTRELLESHPLVERLLTNPQRRTYEGWDDSDNRNRLLAAASDLAPNWIFSLDADERIDAGDAAALRAFLERDAEPGTGYYCLVHRMIGDLDHYDVARPWVGRFFAWEPGQSFPTARYHFVALPTSITPEHYRHTTIRIQHLAGLTPERRRSRYSKYGEVDPDREFQSSYEHLLTPPTRLKRWWTRSAHLPVLANTPNPQPEPLGPDPLVSVVVIAQDDEDIIAEAVSAITRQVCPFAYEVIVVTSGTDRTAQIVREGFPNVQVIELDQPALPGAARNAGLRVARGEYITFPGSHVTIAPEYLVRLVDRFREGYGMVGLVLRNGTPSPAGWASYFLESVNELPGHPSIQLDRPPARCAYLRVALEELGGFPEDMRAAEDTFVNTELFQRGYSAFRDRDVISVHRSPCTHLRALLRHHFARGRGTGRLLVERAELDGHVPNERIKRFVVRNIPSRVRELNRNVRRWGDGLRTRYWLVLPWVILGATSFWIGACVELARRVPGARRRLRTERGARQR